MLMPLGPQCRAHSSKMARDTKMAVNMEAMMPRESVTANPLMGPVPNWYKITVAMIVVRFESVIEIAARSKPAFTAASGVSPCRIGVGRPKAGS